MSATVSGGMMSSAASASRVSRVLAAYKRLLRAQATAFKNDSFMQQNAKREIRRHFLHPLPTQSPAGSSAALDEQLKHADEAASYLLENVIQAEKKENGKYVMNLAERHTVPDPMAQK